MNAHNRFWKSFNSIKYPLLIFFIWIHLSTAYLRLFNTEQTSKLPVPLLLGVALADCLGLLLMYFVIRGTCLAIERRQLTWKRKIPVHALLFSLTLVTQAGLYIWFCGLLSRWFHHPLKGAELSIQTVIMANWAFNLLFYIAIVGGTLALFNFQRFREQERQARTLKHMLTEAQLQNLKAQLHPHFLFNTLHTISAYIYDNPDIAVDMVARLSELLRASLDSEHMTLVPLEKELNMAQKYLEIEHLRFSDRLTINMNIDPLTERALIPTFILQPLLENAMKHGIGEQLEGGIIEIRAVRDNDSISLVVKDNGPGCAQDWQKNTGIGLRNTQSRLENLYGNKARFEAGNDPAGGFVVTIRLPFQVEENGIER